MTRRGLGDGNEKARHRGADPVTRQSVLYRNESMIKRTIMGIDPGVTGAVALLRDDRQKVEDMPSNPRDLWELLTELRGGPYLEVSAIVEQAQAMPKQGVSSTFKTGYGYGVIIGVLASLGIPYETVTPSVWKRAMGLQGKDKDASRSLARCYWPDAPLGRVKDHGRAEALLIAEYGRRKHEGYGAAGVIE